MLTQSPSATPGESDLSSIPRPAERCGGGPGSPHDPAAGAAAPAPPRPGASGRRHRAGDPLAEASVALAGIVGASVQGRVALGPRAGTRVGRLGDGLAPPAGSRGPRQAHLAGFDLHANVWVGPWARATEHLGAPHGLTPRWPAPVFFSGPRFDPSLTIWQDRRDGTVSSALWEGGPLTGKQLYVSYAQRADRQLHGGGLQARDSCVTRRGRRGGF